MNERKPEVMELILNVQDPKFAVYGHGFKTARIPDEVFGSIQDMINKCYRREVENESLDYYLDTDPAGNYVVVVSWMALTSTARTLQFWGRMIDAAVQCKEF